MVMVVAKLVMMLPAYDHDAPGQDLALQGGMAYFLWLHLHCKICIIVFENLAVHSEFDPTCLKLKCKS